MKTRYKGGFKFRKEGICWYLYYKKVNFIGHIQLWKDKWGFVQNCEVTYLITASTLRLIADFIDRLHPEK